MNEYARSDSRSARHARWLLILLDDVPFLVIVTVFSVAALLSHAVLGVPRSLNPAIPWSSVGVQTVVYALVVIALVCTYRVAVRHESLRKAMTWRRIAQSVFEPSRTLSYVVLFLAFGPLMHTFIAFKAAIPIVQPFAWDERFMEWDQWLHFGVHPFAWLQPVLGSPPVTAAIDDVYFAWMSVTWFTVIWQAWHAPRSSAIRSQFLVAFSLCWIVLGNGLATLLSSAGPVYFGAVTGASDPYILLFEYLATVDAAHDLHAVWLQDLLWTVYQDPGLTGLGISAMPSLHVAIAVLLVLLGFAIHRAIGWAYAVFALFILVGSVHLGWHYAIDGYVAALATVPIWWASGGIVRSWRKRVGLDTVGSAA